jgi:hypothetical protein
MMGAVRQLSTAVLVALAVVSHHEANSLESLPPGTYYYEHPSRSASVLLRKAGRSVIGLDSQEQACFRGFIEGDRIVNATRVDPPYQPDSRLEHRDGIMLNLAEYQRVEDSIAANAPFAATIAPRPSLEEHMRQVDRETLQTCIQFFSH